MTPNKLIAFATMGCLSLLVPTAGLAQDKQTFEEFRNGILNDYTTFRNTLLEHYADFLKGEWHEYESLMGEKRNPEPKPKKIPTVKLPKKETPEPAEGKVTKTKTPKEKPVVEKTPVKETPVEKKPVKEKPVKEKPVKEKPVEKKPIKEKTVKESPVEKTPVKETPVKNIPLEETPVKTPKEEKPEIKGETFSFYDIPVTAPTSVIKLAQRLGSPSDFAKQWETMAKAGFADAVLPFITAKADEMGLNDYLKYELVKSYINSKFTGLDDSSKVSAIHYLMVNMGYDARLAVTDSGIPLLLLSFNQHVYDKSFLSLAGGNYYVFTPDGTESSKLAGAMIRTCKLPENIDKGKKLDLILGELNIPFKPHPFNLEYGDLHISGEVNENLMPILYRYPQMPIEGYAQSNINPALRQNIAGQIKDQLAEMESDAATERLLEFMHNVFKYSTDQENHGFEKPYFIEETLYYPKNDCEDRAIFYTYFLWNALGKEAQLISFPGHEACTVKLDTPIRGTAYEYEGKTFYISDPTYIGASTGMIMPDFINTSPTVDYVYE